MRYLQKILNGMGPECTVVMHYLTRQPELLAEESEEGILWLRHDHEDTPLMERVRYAKELAKKLMYNIGGVRLGSVSISRLASGKRAALCRTASDNWFAPYRIVLFAEEGALFTAGDETVPMHTGEVWWYDPSVEIMEINNSGDDRVHLAVDLRLDP
jgi:hypothetical protein